MSAGDPVLADPVLDDPVLDDPVQWFAAYAAEHPRCFWLDGGGARDWSGRRSIIGHLEPGDLSFSYDAGTREVRRHTGDGAPGDGDVVGDDVFAVLERETAAGPADAQWFGYLGYAARPDLPARPARERGEGREGGDAGDGLPDAVWMRPSVVRSYEHPVEATRAPTGDPAPDQRVAVPHAYAAAFARVQDELHAGNSYEVNLTHRVTSHHGLDPVAAYERLRRLNPAPYAGFLQHDVDGARAWLLSSSPERYALVTADRVLETKPIKGTTPRGATPADDEAQRLRLAADAKFRAENLMIVDLLRNDLAMVCRPGTVEVPALMQVESYASVHQLVSTVRGRLRDDVTTWGALRALFPAGSMTGAPKLRTMEIVDAVETTPRGAYAGAFGWVSADGRADLGVVIRTLTTTGDGTWTLGTGGGVTVHSDVAEEWAESEWKADRLLRVFAD